MFTTGSKLLIGASVITAIGALVYGLSDDGVRGTVGLVSAAIALAFLAAINVYVRDSNVAPDDDVAVATAPAAQPTPAGSVWPMLFALSAGLVAVGLVTFPTVLIIGVVGVLAAGAEWVTEAWAERASADPAHNAEVRNRISNPLEFPIGGAVAAGIIIYFFSRIMLWLSKTNTVIFFATVAAVVAISAFIFAYRPSIKRGAAAGFIGLGIIAVLAGGAAAALDGQRDIRTFETTSLWQHEALEHPEEYAEGAEAGKHPSGLICESAEAFPEADEDVSETVAAKSNATTIVLLANGELAFDVPGPIETDAVGVVFPRSNPNNIIFRNESSEERRLSVDYGVDTVEGEDVEIRRQSCTTLIGEGGAQFLTITFPEPSVVYEGETNPNGPVGGDVRQRDGFWFFVPGVETAKLPLVVP
jgi:hypothetical protein